ncbi:MULTISPECIES: GNAT family N-acetyltransferase [Maritimibacter]|uniref:Putative acetyltransferase n=1 Tax=Maritimibacter alkaliphilus HTCC2654 TaxID=314271 RepID=A3VC01_9RHOB|nr:MULTISPECIES: GNAT family N-acetyltransferase [Maritimibacter]EAQ14484.1 putative acetyltransferase [Rhodobacterales bacterium HTCC2654] [Maritimibacter alkaliphilus HTCC2654]
MIRPARPDDLATLGDVAMRSKAHWGYDADFLEACREELSPTAADLGPGLMTWEDEAPRAVAHVVMAGGVAELYLLFVAPEAMGQGIGRDLFGWACDYARGEGAERLGLDADPYATPFYEKMGCVQVGEVPSATWPDRMLPRMEYQL